MTQRIAYPNNPIMAAAWFGLVQFLAGQPDCIRHFEEVSGQRWVFTGGRSPIERMVDTATGYDQAVIDAFIDYVNEYHWGEDPFEASPDAGLKSAAQRSDEVDAEDQTVGLTHKNPEASA